MTPLTATKPTTQKQRDYSEKDSFDAMYHKLEKGIRSMENDEVYTIDEAWAEIDKI